MSIIKYRLINLTKDPKLPFYNDKKDIFYIPLKTSYHYFVEAIVEDGQGGTNYYVLLGRTKFNNNCRICHTDDYGRVQLKLKGNIKEFVIRESIERGNLEVIYIESEDNYDVYHIK